MCRASGLHPNKTSTHTETSTSLTSCTKIGQANPIILMSNFMLIEPLNRLVVDHKLKRSRQHSLTSSLFWRSDVLFFKNVSHLNKRWKVTYGRTMNRFLTKIVVRSMFQKHSETVEQMRTASFVSHGFQDGGW